MRASWVAVLVLGGALVSVRGHADERERCASASEHAQDLRSAGKLRQARTELLTCTPASCPAVVRTDCLKWLAEVEAILPSVVISATDPAGHDAIAVRVSVDGQLVADGLDGKAMPIDPGVHVLRFELAGSPPLEQKLLIREAQKDRSLTVQFKPADAEAHPALPAPLAPPPPAPVASSAPQPVRTAPSQTKASGSVALPLSLTGIGVLGLGAFAVLAIDGQIQYSHCNQSPAPCTSGDINGLAVKRDVAWAAGAAGVATLGAAVWLFVSRRASAPTVGVAVLPAPEGTIAEIAGSF